MGIMDCRILDTDHGLCDSLQMRYIWKRDQLDRRVSREIWLAEAEAQGQEISFKYYFNFPIIPKNQTLLVRYLSFVQHVYSFSSMLNQIMQKLDKLGILKDLRLQSDIYPYINFSDRAKSSSLSRRALCFPFVFYIILAKCKVAQIVIITNGNHSIILIVYNMGDKNVNQSSGRVFFFP